MKDDTIISTYTREQAVEDGVLFRLPTKIREEYGIKDDTCISSGLQAILTDESAAGQSFYGRLHDLLSVFRNAVHSCDDDLCEFIVAFATKDEHGNDTTVETKVWAIGDADGITIMVPDDY